MQVPDLRTPLQRALSTIFELADVRRIASETLKHETAVTVSGLGGSVRGLFVAALWQALKRPLILVTANPVETETLATDIAYFHSELNDGSGFEVCSFPAWDVDPYSGLSPHADVEQARARTLWQMRAGQAGIIVTSARALGSRLPSPVEFDTYGQQLKVSDELSQELMLDHLVTAGYVRQEPVSSVGEFSQRGGIVDIFSPLMTLPVRVEFFGDVVDSIRQFDPDEQRSKNPLQNIDILPMQEHVVGRATFRKWAAAAQKSWDDERYHDDLADKLSLADNGTYFPGWEFLIPKVAPLDAGLADYVEGPVIIVDEPESLFGSYTKYFDSLVDKQEQTDRVGGLTLSPSHQFRRLDELKTLIYEYSFLELEELGGEGADLLVVGQPARRFHGQMREMMEAIRQSWKAGRQVVLLGSTHGMAERLRDILHEYDLPFRAVFGEVPHVRLPADNNAPVIAVGRISAGFRILDTGIEVFAESDIFETSEHFVPSRRRKSRVATFLSDLEDLQPGNYVVHVDHGVGRCEGIATIHDRECMVLSYQEGDKLYVPLERIDLIQKYSATDDSHPRLDRLGGTTWIQRKARVRRAIRDMAEELLKLYAERKVAVGHSFSPDTEWQQEFEEAFQYEETKDQLTAIADIKRDMEAQTPMDRLICGDVGYGKTEVAMRAVFKAVSDGKQVAILSPTTVLCFQHYETLKERFAAFPVKVAMLSRFVSGLEQKQVISEIGAGKIDVVVGTHRVLSKDVQFLDLGLLVVDEEQRFGVAHKEFLKQLTKQVDVVTMTATPIPRTLHMALTGLRDMSVIETAPRDRLAIQTSVVKFNPMVIENAINYELDRGGQVYFVHNRVQSIYSMASYIQQICPRAKVGVGHGQMTEKELERVTLRFMHNEFDVLVSTTIIENGLDIPLANTMFVNRADRYGLAQLYQLRGRVGRSNRRAYAYLLVPSDKTLTPLARRRLVAIREFSELGSGFRIAALDLELRGAGNLLGGEQHGHIEAIGFDLYCQMLERTMDESRTGKVIPDVETTINLQADLKIPPEFVVDDELRLRIYRGIASCRTEEEVDARYKDLEDRLGALPRPIENLLEYARLRVLGREIAVKAIERKRASLEIVFDPRAQIEPDRIVQLVERDPDVSFMPPATLSIGTVDLGRELFASIQRVLRELS